MNHFVITLCHAKIIYFFLHHQIVFYTVSRNIMIYFLLQLLPSILLDLFLCNIVVYCVKWFTSDNPIELLFPFCCCWSMSNFIYYERRDSKNTKSSQLMLRINNIFFCCTFLHSVIISSSISIATTLTVMLNHTRLWSKGLELANDCYCKNYEYLWCLSVLLRAHMC